MDLFNAASATPNSKYADLSQSAFRAQFAKQIRADIDDYCATAYDGGHRNHLGASQIGHVCKRHLFYIFRWAKLDTYLGSDGISQKGRMMRLFNRGHREEERFVEWLRGIGFQVWDVTPEGSQYRIQGCKGHFGGALDGINQAPAKYMINEPMLCEFKTQGTGPKFEELRKLGVAKAKPMHFAQMSEYGYKYSFRYALYMCINKNDDDLYIEIVKLDWELGAQLELKANDIIFSQEPPPKFSLSPATMECRVCTFKDICHGDELPTKSCRSCALSQPIEDGQWYCKMAMGVIPDNFIARGCNEWRPLK